jgi:hypothetical protein
MKKNLAILCFLILICSSAKAQLNMGAIQDPLNLNAARHLPTFLGESSKRGQIVFFNPYAAVGSNFTTSGQALDYLRSDRITNEMIDETVSKLHPENNMVQGTVDLAILNLAFNIRNDSGGSVFTVGFGVNERVETSTTFNEETIRLLYRGNKQYAGQTINLAPRINALGFTEYYVAAAMNIAPSSSPVSFRPALRLSYLAGQASVAMGKSNTISLYTEPQGRFLDFQFDYRVNASLGVDSLTLNGINSEFDVQNFIAGAGHGFGADLGTRVMVSPALSFNIGVIDIGSIRFNKFVTNIYNHSGYRYEGESFEVSNGNGVSFDTIVKIAKPLYAHEDYTVHLPTKLVLTGSMGRGEMTGKHGTYYKHQFTAMYVQGFDNYLSSTTRPYLAVGYTYDFANVACLGANAGLGGIAGGTFGVLASVRVGSLTMGFNSNNVIPLLFPQSGRSADLGLLLGFAF